MVEDRRTVISHQMFVRDDQSAQYRERKKVMAIVLPNHIWLTETSIRRSWAKDGARNITPLKSAQANGVRIGIHNDTPSSGPSALFSIRRRGESENVRRQDAGPGAAD